MIEDVAPELGYIIHERTITLEEVLVADEVFLTGTAAEVIGVSHIGDKVMGTGKVGPITSAFENEFKNRVSKNAPED